jgi:hypothetical protein
MLFRNYKNALKLMQRATTPPPRKTAYYDESETVQNRVYKSLRVSRVVFFKKRIMALSAE